MKTKKYFLIALVIILIDQVVKVVVKTNMALGEEIRVIGNVFKIHFIENKGAAFGMTVDGLLQPLGVNLTPETSKLILTIFSIVAVFFIGYFLYRLADHRSPMPLFVALIFGGALGNIIDRTFYGVIFDSLNASYPGDLAYHAGLLHGRVVDMFYLDIGDLPLPDLLGGGTYHLWPIFNIADASISVGIIVILFFQGKFFRMDAKARGLGPDGKPLPTEEIPDTKTEKHNPSNGSSSGAESVDPEIPENLSSDTEPS